MTDALLVQTGIMAFTGLAALAAWRSADAAKTAAAAAREAASAARFDALATDYDSPGVAQALRALKNWKEGHDRRREFDERVQSWAADAAGEHPSPQARDLNDHRRLVSAVFRRAARLLQSGTLRAELVEDIRSWSGKTIWCDVVRPMEIAYHQALRTSSSDAWATINLIEQAFCVEQPVAKRQNRPTNRPTDAERGGA